MLDSPRGQYGQRESEERAREALKRTARFFLKRGINCYVGLKERRPEKSVKRDGEPRYISFIQPRRKVKSGNFPPVGSRSLQHAALIPSPGELVSLAR